jgi:TonB-dependent SusC/RagA subfamily outer membrane receptor
MKNSKEIKFLVVVSGLLLLSFLQPEIGSRNIEKIRDAFSTYIDFIHPQKVYMHTDKFQYYSGEHIWFRAYLLNGTTHTPETKSQHVYVELVDPYKRVVQILRIRTNAQKGGGDFSLSDTIPEGIYQIRAYTNWMKNFGPEQYFTKNIEIRNSNKKYLITDKEAKQNKKTIKNLNKQKNKYSIGFFPEGGNILARVTTRIAFKVENEFGEGIVAEGKVLNSKKAVVAKFKTEYNGMGSFYLNTGADDRYTAIVQFENGQKEQIVLPVAIENSVGVSIKDESESISLSIKSNKLPSNDRSSNEFVLIGEVRGKIYYASSSNIIDNDTLIKIDKKIFPSGIVHFTLFNNRFTPVSERLFFINHGDFLNFHIDGKAKKDTLHISLQSDFPLVAKYFSGSVTVLLCDSSHGKLPSHNIISNLLLTSDLPGYIPDPAYYLNNKDPVVNRHVDLLMMTHGWQRYIWSDIIEHHYPDINYDIENGITVQGKITREILEFPLKDASVKMFILSEYNDEFLTYSAKNGLFKFENLIYYDTINVKIVARKQGGGKNLLINLEEPEFDEIKKYYGTFFLTTNSEIDIKAYRKQQGAIAKEEYKRREKELDSIYSQTIHGKPDFVLWADELPSGYSNILEAMQGRIPGVVITGDQIIIRGVGTIFGNTDPLVLVEGIPSNVDMLRNIPVEDVERIEILKGPSASMYGSRGGNGVIAVYTKRGQFMKKGEISFSMLGYHIAEKFHSPSTDLIKRRIEKQELPVTIYWNPELQLSDDELVLSIPLERSNKEIVILLEGIDQQGKLGFAYARMR